MGKVKDLTGQRFGRLTVLYESPERLGGFACWVCKCDCGNITKPIRSNNLKSGTTKSCGCLSRETTQKRSLKHGCSNSKIYRAWENIKTRCLNNNSDDFKNYGARGIKICKEWESNFQAFYDWSMSHGYEEHLTIDRIDVNGNYCPENCRWSTMKEQQRNRRNNRIITAFGESLTMSQWSEKTGIPTQILYMRLKSGWSVERALTTKVRKCRRKRKWQTL